MLTRLIPSIFYASMQDGLDLFVEGMAFKLLHRDGKLAVVERDSAKAYLVEDAEFAAKNRPEIAIETDTIEDLYAELSLRSPELLHPNGKVIERKPWGAREFALLDKTGVCVVFREW